MAEGVCVVVDILQAQRWYLMRAMKTRGDSCVNVSMQEPKHAGFYSDRPRDQPSSHQQVMQIISPDSNDMRVLSPLKKILGELPLCCWWTLLVTSASNTETNKSHWKIMVEFKSTHSKSQISDVKKKRPWLIGTQLQPLLEVYYSIHHSKPCGLLEQGQFF